MGEHNEFDFRYLEILSTKSKEKQERGKKKTENESGRILEGRRSMSQK